MPGHPLLCVCVCACALHPLLFPHITYPGGPNVYEGVRIDYRGSDVTAENFLSVLLGDKAAMAGKGTGRVVESGPHDKVSLGGACSCAWSTSVLELSAHQHADVQQLCQHRWLLSLRQSSLPDTATARSLLLLPALHTQTSWRCTPARAPACTHSCLCSTVTTVLRACWACPTAPSCMRISSSRPSRRSTAERASRRQCCECEHRTTRAAV